MAHATQNPRSSMPLYPIADAALYGRVHPMTLKHWVDGYEGRGRQYDALLRLPDQETDTERLLSFENLIEVALIGSWRRRGIPLQWIRRAQELAISDFGPHPFATQQVYVSGTDLFMRAEDETDADGGATFTVITKGNQRVLAPAIREYLSHIDWRTGEASPFQWRPREGDDVVKLNPDISFGLPAVRRIRTEVIRERFLSREPIALIADDFGLETEEVETALRYEWSLRRAA